AFLLSYATENEIIALLLQLDLHPLDKRSAISFAANNNDMQRMQLLLTHFPITTAYDHYVVLSNVVDNNAFKALDLLLTINPKDSQESIGPYHDILIRSIMCKRIKIVELLLADTYNRFDPTFAKYEALSVAALNEDAQMLRLLLKDKHIDKNDMQLALANDVTFQKILKELN